VGPFAASGKDAGVNGGMQSLYPAVKTFGESGKRGDVDNGNFVFPQMP
jgi:hypothetical protein